MIEVEVKARVEPAIIKFPLLQKKAMTMGFDAPGAPETTTDVYYKVGAGETFRIRSVIVEPGLIKRAAITYKSPSIVDKSRRETEIPFHYEDAGDMQYVLGEAFALYPFLDVKKVRVTQPGNLTSTHGVTICYDVVDGLGTFIEVERVIPDQPTLLNADLVKYVNMEQDGVRKIAKALIGDDAEFVSECYYEMARRKQFQHRRLP